MIPILDWLYVLKKRLTHARDSRNAVSPRPLITLNGNPEPYSFCFVPKFVLHNQSVREGIIPQQGTAFIYKMSSSYHLAVNPEDTLSRLQAIEDDVSLRISQLPKGRDIRMVGVSFGNVLAFKTAAEHGARELIPILPGAKLGACAYDSALTGRIARQSGLSYDSYVEALSSFDPIAYVPKLIAERIEMHIATRDIMIRYHHGKELADSLLQHHTHARVYVHRGADHAGGIMRASRERKERKF